jgi:hypothetical protein
LLVILHVFLPLALAAVASFSRCLAQRKWQLMFVVGPLYGSMVAALVFAAFATFVWCFPSGGQGPSPVGMGDPSGTTWAILTGAYAIVGAVIGLGTATAVSLARHFRRNPPLVRFTIRDVLWLTVVVALACGWAVNRIGDASLKSDRNFWKDTALVFRDALVKEGYSVELDPNLGARSFDKIRPTEEPNP